MHSETPQALPKMGVYEDRGTLNPQRAVFPYNKDLSKVPLLAETPKCVHKDPGPNKTAARNVLNLNAQEARLETRIP